jgi:hypothetical protein
MRIKRSLPILLSLLVLAAAVAIVVVLRKHAPPEAARLLPGADGFVYFDLKWLRRVNVASQLPKVVHDPEYERFIQATGFQFERDLDQAALAIHYPPKLRPGMPPPAFQEPRYSEIFMGKIDGQRLRQYLKGLSNSVEDYNSTNIYNIPLEGRTLRVAVLAVDTVAASNHPDPQVIHGIIDRSRKLASPFGGPALLRQYYKYVPFTSLAWAIFRADPDIDKVANAPVGMSFLFSEPAVVLVSARYLGSINLRAEAFTASEQAAKQVADQMNVFLSLFHSAETSVHEQGPDPDVKHFFDSLKVSQDGTRTVLTATVPPGFIQKALAGPPQAPEPAMSTGKGPAKPEAKKKTQPGEPNSQPGASPRTSPKN